MRNFVFIFASLLAMPVFATTQTVKQGRLNYAFQRIGMPSSQISLTLGALANTYYYDTYAELATATPAEGVFGWAIDTNAMYYYNGSSWVPVLAASSSGLLGTNGGTIGNETNNVWTFAENSEDFTATFAGNLVTFASGTSATFAFTPAVTFAGDVTLNGGASGLTFGAASSSIVVPDGSATALVLGSTGRLDLLGFVTTDDLEKVVVKGTTTATAFHVDIGDAQFDEDITIGAGAGGIDYVLTFNGEDNDGTITWMEDESRLDLGSHVQIGAGTATVDYVLTFNGEDNDGSITYMEDEDRFDFDNDVYVTGDLTLHGGAGTLTFDAASSSVVVPDNSATGLILGSSGLTNLMTLDTTTDNQKLMITGTTTATALHVDVGLTQLDEDVTIGAGAAGVDYKITFNGEDNDGILTWAEDEIRFDLGAHVKIGAAGAGIDYVLTFDGEDNDGSITYMEDEDRLDVDNDLYVTGDLTLHGGAGTLTFDAASSSVVVPDNSATGLILGSSGLANLMTLDTRTGQEQLMVTGTTANTALNVAVGLANFAELVGIDGGAGAITFTNTAASIVLKDADASALDIGSTGRTDLMRFVTTDDAEKVVITGHTGDTALDVPVGEVSITEGANLAIPVMTLHEFRFCGNGPNGNTPMYNGPILEADMDTDMTFGGAACDSNDDTIETNVDDAPIPSAYKPVAMTCFIAAGGTDDTLTFQMREDTSDVTGLTCDVTVDGAAAKQCTVRLPAPETVAAGSLVDIKMVATDDDMTAVDVECRVWATF